MAVKREKSGWPERENARKAGVEGKAASGEPPPPPPQTDHCNGANVIALHETRRQATVLVLVLVPVPVPVLVRAVQGLRPGDRRRLQA